MQTTITESSSIHKGITLISVHEVNEYGYTVCSGCKQPIKIDKAYSMSQAIDENTRKFYSVHKGCGLGMVTIK